MSIFELLRKLTRASRQRVGEGNGTRGTYSGATLTVSSCG